MQLRLTSTRFLNSCLMAAASLGSWIETPNESSDPPLPLKGSGTDTSCFLGFACAKKTQYQLPRDYRSASWERLILPSDDDSLATSKSQSPCPIGEAASSAHTSNGKEDLSLTEIAAYPSSSDIEREGRRCGQVTNPPKGGHHAVVSTRQRGQHEPCAHAQKLGS